jgi:hypothetical protein
MKNVTVTMEDKVADGARMEAAHRNGSVWTNSPSSTRL